MQYIRSVYAILYYVLGRSTRNASSTCAIVNVLTQPYPGKDLLFRKRVGSMTCI